MLFTTAVKKKVVSLFRFRLWIRKRERLARVSDVYFKDFILLLYDIKIVSVSKTKMSH